MSHDLKPTDAGRRLAETLPCLPQSLHYFHLSRWPRPLGPWLLARLPMLPPLPGYSLARANSARGAGEGDATSPVDRRFHFGFRR